MSEDEVARLTRVQVVPFLRSVIASGERLSDHDMDAIAAALSGVPEGAASEDEVIAYLASIAESGAAFTNDDVQFVANALRSVPSPESLDEVRRMVAHELRDTDDWADYVDITVPLSRMRAIRDALAAPQPVPEDET